MTKTLLPYLTMMKGQKVFCDVGKVDSVSYKEDFHVQPISALGRGVIDAKVTMRDSSVLSVGLEDYLAICKGAKVVKRKMGRKASSTIRDLAKRHDAEVRAAKKDREETEKRKRAAEKRARYEAKHPEIARARRLKEIEEEERE